MSFDLVVIGGTGDLAWRKLMPALFQAFRHGKLPEGGRILAVSRQEMTDDAYRAWLKERFLDVEGAKRPSDDEFARFAGLLHYLRLDLSQPAGYADLKAWLASNVGRDTPADVVVMYLATSPDLFTTVCAQLGAAGLNGDRVRVVLEKPLGHDLASAREINRVVRSVFREEQAFRIDHYLGKPAVPARYWPRTTSRATLSAVKGLSERSTFSFSSRIASARLRDGGSMAIIVNSCSAWFWIMSRSAPVRL